MSTTPKSTAPSSTPRSVEATELDPKKIAPHPLNPREDAAADDGLVASVREHGVLERLVLAPVPADLPAAAKKQVKRGTEFVLIAGHRRRDAAVQAKAKTVPVDIRHDLDTTEAQLAVIAAENVHRRDLSVLEEGDVYLAMLDLGLSQGQVHDRTGVGKPRISERSRVAKLPPSAREKVANNQLSLDSALVLARVDDPEEVDRILKKPSWDWQHLAQRWVADRDAAREVERKAAAYEKAGVTVVTDLPDDPEDDDTPRVDLVEFCDWPFDNLKVARAIATHAKDDHALEVLEHHDDPARDAELDEVLDTLTTDEAIEGWHQATCKGHVVRRLDYPATSWRSAGTSFDPHCTTPSVHDDLRLDNTSRDGRPGVQAGHGDDSTSASSTPQPSGPSGDELAAASKHRRAWLAQLLKQDDNRLSGVCYQLLRDGNLTLGGTAVLYRPEREAQVLLEVLAEVNPPEGDFKDKDAVLEAWPKKGGLAHSLPRFLLAHAIAHHVGRDVALDEEPREWANVVADYGYCRSWVQVLDALGYPWTDDELSWLGRTPDFHDAAVDESIDEMLAADDDEEGAA